MAIENAAIKKSPDSWADVARENQLAKQRLERIARIREAHQRTNVVHNLTETSCDPTGRDCTR